MIVAWMLTHVVVGGLMLLVAFGADAMLAQLRRSRRWAWMMAMMAMCVLPLLLRNIVAPVPLVAYSGVVRASATRPSAAATSDPVLSAAPANDAPVVKFSAAPGAGNRVVVAPDSPLLSVDRLGALLWLGSSLVCIALLLAAHRRMSRTRRQWRTAPDEMTRAVTALTGMPTRVWCSDDIGPAAFGVLDPQIVIPEWAAALDAPARALVMQHEASHVTARDPLLLRIALTLVVLIPWNLPLLIAYRRLHRAVEHDCDARVLAASDDARGYGRLLLTTAERLTTSSQAQAWARAARWLPAPIPGIGTRRTELEARLRAMVRPVSTWRSRIRMIGAGAVVILGVVAACSVPSPERMPGRNSPDKFSRVTALDSLVRYDSIQKEMGLFLGPRADRVRDSIVISLARKAYPALLAPEATGERWIWLLFDSNYKLVAATQGMEFAFERAGGSRPAGSRPPVPGALTTTPRIVVSSESFENAFPIVADIGIGRHGWKVIPVAQGTVNVQWGVLQSDTVSSGRLPDSLDVIDLLGRSDRSMHWSPRQKRLADDAFKTFLREKIAQVEPRSLDVQSTDDPFVWILVDRNGRVHHHATGRVGLSAKSKGRVDVADGTLATRDTPIEDLIWTCSAFRVKFAPLNPLLEPASCGFTATLAGVRKVSVIWGVTGPLR